MAHITDKELNNPERDSFWKDHYSELGKKLKVDETLIKNFATQGLVIREAENHAASIFEAEFRDEFRDIPQFKQSMLSRISEATRHRDKMKAVVDGLRERGEDKEQTGMRIDIPTHEKIGMGVASFGAWMFYLAGLASTAIFLHDTAGFEWWKAFVFPIAGVSALVFGLKFGLNSLASTNNKLAPVVKWAVLVIGLVCAVGWLKFYAEFAGSVTKGPAFESLDGTPQDNSDPNAIIMIVLGALGESLVAAFLFQVVYDKRKKHTFYDSVIDTQPFLKAQKDLQAAQSELDRLNSRCNYSDSLLEILGSAKDRLINDAQSIYKLEEARRTQGN
jgi:hypothetical protein